MGAPVLGDERTLEVDGEPVTATCLSMGNPHAVVFVEDVDKAAVTTLGPRLVEISRALLALPGSNATAVMGTPDDLKLRSSMTLFAQVPGADPVFQQVLDKFFGGRPDEQTLRRLGR